MRAVGALGLLGVLIAVGIMYIIVGGGFGGTDSETTKDGPVLAVAYGKVAGGAYELHVGGDFASTKADPPRNKDGAPQWDDWIDAHFKLVDAHGNSVPLRSIENSKLMIGADKQDFLLAAPVKQGAGYELTFRPKGNKKEQYQHKFSVLPTGNQMTRQMLKPI